MLRAIVSDLAAINGVDVSILDDPRADSGVSHIGVRHIHRRVAGDAESTCRLFGELASAADATLVIAPEIGDCLSVWVERAVSVGATLLGPGPELIALASDKNRTAEFLQRHGVPVPAGCVWTVGDPLPDTLSFPGVVKPVRGAGCHGVRKVESASELRRHVDSFGDVTWWRIETWCPGVAASISAVCDAQEDWLLPPCTQQLSDDLSEYLGGEIVQDGNLVERAKRLVRPALEVLPDKAGYLGFDLVLGGDPYGTQDYLIEINPRLTTSYMTLRRELGDAIARRMLRPYVDPTGSAVQSG